MAYSGILLAALSFSPRYCSVFFGSIGLIGLKIQAFALCPLNTCRNYCIPVCPKEDSIFDEVLSLGVLVFCIIFYYRDNLSYYLLICSFFSVLLLRLKTAARYKQTPLVSLSLMFTNYQ